MDPTANLTEQREIMAEIEDDNYNRADLERLAELCKALDEWIADGGALPEQWEQDF